MTCEQSQFRCRTDHAVATEAHLCFRGSLKASPDSFSERKVERTLTEKAACANLAGSADGQQCANLVALCDSTKVRGAKQPSVSPLFSRRG